MTAGICRCRERSEYPSNLNTKRLRASIPLQPRILNLTRIVGSERDFEFDYGKKHAYNELIEASGRGVPSSIAVSNSGMPSAMPSDMSSGADLVRLTESAAAVEAQGRVERLEAEKENFERERALWARTDVELHGELRQLQTSERLLGKEKDTLRAEKLSLEASLKEMQEEKEAWTKREIMMQGHPSLTPMPAYYV